MDGNLPPPLSGSLRATTVAGDVVQVDGATVVLRLEGRQVTGRRAASCLLEPAAGDGVLAAEVGGRVYVLAILERPSGGEAVLSVAGADTVTLAQDSLTMRCGELTVEAGRASLRSRAAQVASRTLSAVAERLDVVARTLRRTADHEFSHAKAATRTVEGAEAVTAGELLLEARTALAQRGGIVLIDAREDVRINGERITMG